MQDQDWQNINKCTVLTDMKMENGQSFVDKKSRMTNFEQIYCCNRHENREWKTFHSLIIFEVFT